MTDDLRLTGQATFVQGTGIQLVYAMHFCKTLCSKRSMTPEISYIERFISKELAQAVFRGVN